MFPYAYGKDLDAAFRAASKSFIHPTKGAYILYVIFVVVFQELCRSGS